VPTDLERAVEASWIEGRLYIHLNPSQKKIYDAYKASKDKNTRFVVNCSRKIGKSVLGMFVAAEACIQRPNALVAFIAPTIDDVQKYARQLVEVAFTSCPAELRPRLTKTELVFPNGSRVLFRGVGKGQGSSYNNLRSFAFDLIVLDEAGFSSHLDEIVDGALMSTLLPRRGNMLMLSTPPVTPDHAFPGYCEAAKLDGAYIELTIRDSHYPVDVQDKFIKELGGIMSHKVQREYFCKFIVDKDLQLCPEWKTDYEMDVPLDDGFKHFFKYEFMDQGWTDKSVCLFGYVRHQKKKQSQIVFMDEISMQAPEQTTDLLAQRIKEKEKELFETYEVKKRIADNNTPSLLQDFVLRHQLYFYPVESKTYLDVMVSDVRELVREGRMLVSPKCVQLIGCLRNGVWTKTKSGARGKEFDRSKAYGHYDGFAAAMYGVRSADLDTNPLPPEFRHNEENTFIPKKLLEGDNAQTAEIIAAGLDEAMNQQFNYKDHDRQYED
jgi:hypothetical protein